jgi:aminoglycoside phosphotransferase (APT) family kinase protein
LESELRAWLIRSGLPDSIKLTTLPGYLGSTEMWSFSPSPDEAALIARLFAEGADAAARREWLAMRAAACHGIPVPLLRMQGTVADRPVIVMTRIRGVPAMQSLLTRPGGAHALGVAMGQTLGRLHQVMAPAGLVSTSTAWIDKGGPALVPIRDLLATVPRQGRLLHLDFHPNNVLIDEGDVTGVVDWENAMAGPPHMDLARSRAIVRAGVLGGRIAPEDHRVFARFERGLVAGHTRVIGVDPHPALSAAWGLSMTVDDLVRQRGKADSWLTEGLVDRLAEERDTQIELVCRGKAL